MPVKSLIRSLKWGAGSALCALILSACGGGGGDGDAPPAAPVVFRAAEAPAKLSQWNAVRSEGSTLSHHAAVVPYDLSSALFSDYALKMRGLYVPAGKKINYTTVGTLDFPVGTAIYKTFYFPKATGTDPVNYLPVGKVTSNPQGSTIDLAKHRLIETRILVLEADGRWAGTTYVWDADQKDASLNTSGKYVEMELVAAVGAPEKFTYVVPNAQTCQKCHATESAGSGPTLPIGTKVRNMNKDYVYADGVRRNQLVHLNDLQLLAGFPGQPAAPVSVDWADAAKPLGDRARAYLDVNCAHCHNGKGNASQSGLKLTHEDIGSAATSLWGVCKKPLAYAGTGRPGYTYDINPGSPESSILLYRMAHTEAGQTMPVVGRQTVHTEATSMVGDWIRQLSSVPSSLAACPE
jgi:uncharacterized repeat protein (TIGR03806 family)